jgi:hypothetical protein
MPRTSTQRGSSTFVLEEVSADQPLDQIRANLDQRLRARELDGYVILPRDLSDAVGSRTLMRMVFESVDATEWTHWVATKDDATPQPVLRTLLTFCYSSGVFPSAEIERAAGVEGNIRYLCANDYPTWPEVKQFRRMNMSSMRESVARVLQSVCDVVGAQASFLACLVEADRRLRLAVEAASAALDI